MRFRIEWSLHTCTGWRLTLFIAMAALGVGAALAGW